jgi:16S rRNA (guanine1207-N2)-methyltransferase
MNAALETLMLAAVAGSSGTDTCRPSHALFLGAEPHPAIKAWPRITGWQPLKPLADTWDSAGFARLDDVPPEKWPLVLVLPGKSRDETLAWFAMARDHLQAGGRIVVAMPNAAGAGRFEKQLARATGNITSFQKHKCRAFHAVDDGTWNEDLFSEWREIGKPREIPASGFITQAGIFSSGHIDPGSQFLADHLPASLHGNVADLGAGWGFLSDAALRRSRKIEQLALFEADSRALECARTNLAVRSGSDQSHSTHISFHWHNVAAGIPGTYDAIMMNPPFHTGQATDIDLGRAFLTTAAAALRRGGKLFLVANRQLPYESLLDSLKLSWRKPAENPTYKLLFAEKR